MKIYASLGELPVGDRRRAVAIGTFDGVHLGHRAIIATARELGEARGIPTMVITFQPHPISVLRPDIKTTVLTPLETKIGLIADCDADELLILPFTQAFSRIRADRFVDMISSPPLGAEVVVVGVNFRFGSGGSGTADGMRAYGRSRGIDVVTPGIVSTPDGKPISSTRIRRYISEGRMEDVAALLGRPHVIDGTVVHGDQRGRTLGLPTANLAVPTGTAIPGRGVYAGIAFTPTGATRAAINIGLVPTFRGDNPLEALRIEAFLLDYHGGDLYDQPLRLTFTTKLRDEQRFEGPDALVAQIHEDIARTRELVTLPGTDPNAG